MDDSQLSDFLRKLALRADGPPIAIEILGMRVFGAKSDKLSVSEAIKDMGRELIAQVSFTNRESHHHEFMLARLIEVSLDRPEDYPLAHELARNCRRNGPLPNQLRHFGNPESADKGLSSCRSGCACGEL